MKESRGFATVGASKPPDRATATAYLLCNILVLPGLGTVMGGRKTGYLQLALALAGLVLLGAVALTVIQGIPGLQSEPDPAVMLDRLRELLVARGSVGLGGMVLSLLAWVWGLISGVSMLRASAS